MKRRGPWAAWLLAVAASFAWLEWLAVVHRRFEPLTWFLQRMLGIRPRRPWRWPATAAFVAVWVWLTGHLINHVSQEAS